jgi:DNA repair protein RadC
MDIHRTGEDTFVRCPTCSADIPLTLHGLGWAANSPSAVAHRLMLGLGHEERECLDVLLLNTKNIVTRQCRVYQGNVSASLVRVGELFTEAVRQVATGVILVHNHPPGDPTPSPDDLQLTAAALAAGRLLDIQVLDHIVVTRDAFVSLRDRGISFDRTTE